MLRQKEGAGAGTPTPSIKHKEPTPVISSIVAPSGSSGKTNTVVLTGVDTLVVTVGGAISPSSWLINQQFIWSDYQRQFDYSVDSPMEIQLNNDWWVLRPYGMKQYKYVLDNPEIGHIRIWNVDKWSSAVPSKQHIYIDFRSSWIHQHKLEDLYDEVIKVVAPFFREQLQPDNVLVSRGDLHSDITNGNTFLSESQVRNTITRSKYRNYYNGDDVIYLTDDERKLLTGAPYYNKGTQKLIDTDVLDKLLMIADRQVSIGADNVVYKREIETAYFGKKTNDVWGKCYDKTKEVKYKGDDNTPLLWEENGWNCTDTVVRAEFSMRRSFIKEMDNGSYVNLKDFISNIDKIWEFLTSKWMRMVDEVKKNNIQLSVVSKFWSVVQSSFSLDKTSNIIRKRIYNSKINQLIKQGIGCLKKAGSIGMNDNEDKRFLNCLATAVKKGLSSSYHSGEILQQRIHLGLA